jgi:hypothetical protein
MTAPVLLPTPAQFGGVAKELATAPGTPVAMTNTLLTDNLVYQDLPQWLADQANRGVMGTDSFNEIQGVMWSTITMGGPLNTDTFGFLAANILGDVTTTGASSPFTHAIALLNPTSGNPGAQPVTDTFTAYNGVPATVGARQIPYGCLSQLVVDFDALSGLLKWSATVMGWPTVLPGVRPTAAPSSVKPLAPWIGTVGVGGTAVGAPVATLRTGKITMNREVEPEPTVNGLQKPLGMARAGFSVTTDLTFIAQDESIYNHMINNDEPQVQLIFSAGANQSIQFDFQQMAFQNIKPDYGAKVVRWATQTNKCVFNSTNVGTSGGQGPMKITLVNSLPSGTYA